MQARRGSLGLSGMNNVLGGSGINSFSGNIPPESTLPDDIMGGAVNDGSNMPRRSGSSGPSQHQQPRGKAGRGGRSPAGPHAQQFGLPLRGGGGGRSSMRGPPLGRCALHVFCTCLLCGVLRNSFQR